MSSSESHMNTPSGIAGRPRPESGRASMLRALARVQSDLAFQHNRKRLTRFASLLERAAQTVRRSKQQPTVLGKSLAQRSCQADIDEGQFAFPFRIHLGEMGTVRCVSNIHEALDCLIYGWPAGHSTQHAHALDTCLHVLAKTLSSTEAEAAFAKAAEEAGILVHGSRFR